MGRQTLSSIDYARVRSTATRGGTTRATRGAEEKIHQGLGLDPLVDPKGLPHLGPVRMSLPRFEQRGDLWELTVGLPMAEETLLDTTGSMGNNVELAFASLPKAYAMYTTGDLPVLGRYDAQIATAIFNDIQDGPYVALLARSQFEMAEKIAQQMTMLPPGGQGCGNGKEDPQFGLFAAAYLTAASICNWGLKSYHFTVSDEPIVEHIDRTVVERLFGEDVFDRVGDNGFDLSGAMPTTAQSVATLQERAHAFFLQVYTYDSRERVNQQWTSLYGPEHVVVLPGSTEHLHFVKAVIIGLTEGVLDLGSASEFMQGYGLDKSNADLIVRAVAHIPLAAQTTAENFSKIPMAGDLFREKTDLWPVNPDEVDAVETTPEDTPNWL